MIIGKRVGAILGLLLVAGCTTGDPVESSTDLASQPFTHEFRDCMTAKGWQPSEDTGQSLSYSYPSEQREQFNADHEECEGEAGLSAELPPMSRTEAEEYAAALFDHYDCVIKQGYSLPDPPSMQAAIDELMQSPMPSWAAQPSLAAQLSDAENAELEHRCPMPTGWPDGYLDRLGG
ncbi:hypothetical protein JQS43_22800 [Natronosporangium hydrolyticum]|uniref:Lipoprotein n=1 Tax=Natronosporangium hydrolyticum TaxID=2811111 RepID=A0A895YAA7_9ACTN|nr:hypothetical protein [Natronosporangium hydrolyticum]QSB14301.1 hypothetical protein JQS43_22800 [Natronosporangium hydrolyticum]